MDTQVDMQMDTPFEEEVADVEIKPKAIRLRSKALREIRDQQKSTGLIVPSAPFQRIIHEMASEHLQDVRIKKSAVKALQTDMEAMLVDMFSDAKRVAIKAGRETLQVEDIRFLKTIGKYNF